MGLNPFPLFPQETQEQRGVDPGQTQSSGARLLLESNTIMELNPICLRSIDGLEPNRLSRALMRRGSRRERRRLSKKRRRDNSPHNPDQAVFRQIRRRKLAMCMFFFYKRWVCRNVVCPAPVARGFCDKQSRRRSGEPPTLRPLPISPCRRRAGARRGVCPLLQIR